MERARAARPEVAGAAMEPKIERIRDAAYSRWERRGRMHGYDRADWLAAERQARFALNYRVVCTDRFDAESPRPIGPIVRRRCRYCAQSTPRTEFAGPVPILPTHLGIGSPVAYDICAECDEGFSEGIDAAIVRFARPFLIDFDGPLARPSAIPVDAYKGLVKIAIALMPASDLEEYEETVEWVANPDHDFDLNVFRDLTCVGWLTNLPSPHPWTILATRIAPDQPWPGRLLFLGIGRVILQVAIPMGQLDEDQDVLVATPPEVCPPSPFGPAFDPVTRVVLPIRSCSAAHHFARMSA